MAGPAIGNDVGFHDRVSLTIALDADLLSRFHGADQLIRHVRWKIDLRAVIEQQAIHLPMGIHQVLPDCAFGSKACLSEPIGRGSLWAAFDPVAAGPGEPAVMPQAASSMLRPRRW